MQSMPIKYVIIDECCPMLFIAQNHKDMLKHGNITSAGFVTLANGTVTVYGKSHSLDMAPSRHDAHIIARALGLSA